MIQLKDIHTGMAIEFPNFYQAGKWLLEKGYAKNVRCSSGLKVAIKNQTVVFKRFLVYEKNEEKENL